MFDEAGFDEIGFDEIAEEISVTFFGVGTFTCAARIAARGAATLSGVGKLYVSSSLISLRKMFSPPTGRNVVEPPTGRKIYPP